MYRPRILGPSIAIGAGCDFLRKAEIFYARWEWFNFSSHERTIHVRLRDDFQIISKLREAGVELALT
jgi:hypothetical protein